MSVGPGAGRRRGGAGLDRRAGGLLPGRGRPARAPCSTSTSPRSTTPTATSSPASCGPAGSRAGAPSLYCGLPLYSESQAGYLHPLKYLLYPVAADLAGVEPRHGAVGLAGGAGGLRLAASARRAGRGADRRGGLRPGRIHLGAPGPHEHDERPDERPVRLLGARGGVGRGPAAWRGAGGAGPGVPGLRRPPAGHDPHRGGRGPVWRSTARRPSVARRDGSRRWGRRPAWSSWGWRWRPCSGSPRRSCSTARPAPAGSPGTS